MLKNKALEHLIEKLLHAFDPLLDPIFGAIRNGLTWLRNRLSRHKLPKPTVMTEAEYDTDEGDLVLLVP